jgi:hypothetical protein
LNFTIDNCAGEALFQKYLPRRSHQLFRTWWFDVTGR